MNRQTSTPIQISEKAAAYIKNLIISEEKLDKNTLYIKVVAGGCSGFSYDLSFIESNPQNIDTQYAFSTKNINVIIDKRSYFYIVGSTLDYSEGFDGKGLHFTNPQIVRSCSCGSSFSL